MHRIWFLCAKVSLVRKTKWTHLARQQCTLQCYKGLHVKTFNHFIPIKLVAIWHIPVSFRNKSFCVKNKGVNISRTSVSFVKLHFILIRNIKKYNEPQLQKQ